MKCELLHKSVSSEFDYLLWFCALLSHTVVDHLFLQGNTGQGNSPKRPRKTSEKKNDTALLAVLAEKIKWAKHRQKLFPKGKSNNINNFRKIQLKESDIESRYSNCPNQSRFDSTIGNINFSFKHNIILLKESKNRGLKAHLNDTVQHSGTVLFTALVSAAASETVAWLKLVLELIPPISG